jgi:hypothetical protein
MKTYIGKTASLFVVLVIAMLATGISYAMWSKNLYIDGTANTGELDWGFIGASCLDTSGNDYHCRDGFTGPPPYYGMGDKDVGSTGVTITDPHTVTVTLTNVYPSYFTSVDVDAQNTGTIPLIIDRVVIDGHVQRKLPTQVIRLDLNGDGIEDVEIKWGDGFGTQLDPGDLSPTMSFWIHILQGAPQGQTFGFTIEIVAIQWNEYIPP